MSEVKNTIQIEWLSDRHACDTCGPLYAEGACVKLNGDVLVYLEPTAHCHSGNHYPEEAVYKAVFEALGYEVEEI